MGIWEWKEERGGVRMSGKGSTAPPPLCATRYDGSEQRCSRWEDPDRGRGRDGVPGRLEVRITPRRSWYRMVPGRDGMPPQVLDAAWGWCCMFPGRDGMLPQVLDAAFGWYRMVPGRNGMLPQVLDAACGW
jgi:hypothetical protein